MRKAKAEIRRQALLRRRALVDKEERSRQVWGHLWSFSPLLEASVVCCYVALPEEVQTQDGLRSLLAHGKQVLVPFCAGDELEVRAISSLKELAPGRWGIPEPIVSVRDNPDRRVPLDRVDIVLVPGLAFDRSGRRLGWGKGFYDRFLRRLPARCLRVGLAYECQLFPELPLTPHDVLVEVLVTEGGIILCR